MYTTGTPYTQYTVAMSGYNSYLGSLTMPEEGQTVNEYATLNPIPTQVQYGSLYVWTSPSGAAVYLNGNYRGVSPLTISSLSPGSYSVSADLSGYQSQSDTVTIYAGQQQTESFTLEKIVSPGTLYVVSTPSGANVYADGTYKGVTPLTLTGVSPGTHIVELDLTGYYDWKSTVTVGNGQTQTITATMSPITSKTGWIIASSTPANANVYVDSVFKGTTPASGGLTLSGISVGSHTVRFDLSGYRSYSTQVTVSADSYSSINAVLQQGSSPSGAATLQISTTPSGADVYIDNVFRGYSPLTLTDITAGQHTIMAQMTGYQDASITVAVTTGSTMPVSLTLASATSTKKSGDLLLAILTGVVAMGIGILFFRKRQ
ncbi:MAG: PEGA domain-containing protein [Methanoregulaceae archaeon]